MANGQDDSLADQSPKAQDPDEPSAVDQKSDHPADPPIDLTLDQSAQQGSQEPVSETAFTDLASPATGPVPDDAFAEAASADAAFAEAAPADAAFAETGDASFSDSSAPFPDAMQPDIPGDSLGASTLGQGVFATSEALRYAATRVPPHSIESEQALLGAFLLSSEGFENSSDIVIEDDFYQHDHRLIFRAIDALARENQPCDVVTVTGWLEQNALLADAGGLQYIAALAEESPGPANIVAYANIVRERSVLRQLIAVSNDISEAAYTPEGRNSKELLDLAETRVFSIADQTAQHSQGFSNIKNVLASTLDRISYLFETQQSITGLGTGFTELDEKTSGLQSSDLIIVAGRPSMGKTTFAMNIAENAAIAGDHPVAVFSMEMPADQLAMRMIASLGRIELQKLRSGKLSEQDWPRITSAISLLNTKRNLFIDDTPALTPTDVKARARRLKREHNGLGLIVIDYLQLMRVPGTAENKATEIAEISRSLKALAKELDVPIIALSQLNRSLEQRPDKRPIMSDLRESGAIEQDADVIIFIFREEVYEPEKEEVKGVAEILIRKQRNGPIGSVKLTFLGANTRFENYSPELNTARNFGAPGAPGPGVVGNGPAPAASVAAAGATTGTAAQGNGPAAGSTAAEPTNIDDF